MRIAQLRRYTSVSWTQQESACCASSLGMKLVNPASAGRYTDGSAFDRSLARTPLTRRYRRSARKREHMIQAGVSPRSAACASPPGPKDAQQHCEPAPQGTAEITIGGAPLKLARGNVDTLYIEGICLQDVFARIATGIGQGAMPSVSRRTSKNRARARGSRLHCGLCRDRSAEYRVTISSWTSSSFEPVVAS